MKQLDLVGDLPLPDPFKDLPNMRASTAERKAQLLMELGELINRAPPHASIDTIQKVRDYKFHQQAARKVAGNTRSTVPQIEGAINQMRRFWVAS